MIKSNKYIDIFHHKKLKNSYFSVIYLEKLCNKNDINTALVLSLLRQLNDDIELLRNKYKIGQQASESFEAVESLDYLTEDNYRDYYNLLNFEDLPSELEYDVNTTFNNYKMSYRWEDSLLALLHYGVLFVPTNRVLDIYTTDSIIYEMKSWQKSHYNKIDEQPHNLRNMLVDKGYMEEKFRVNVSPVRKTVPKKPKLIIEISEGVSYGKLIEYLKENRKIIELSLNKLTTTPSTSMDASNSNAFYWGHKVWAYKQYVDENAGYGAIEKWLDQQLPDTDVPESRALQTYYKRFVNYKDKFLA